MSTVRDKITSASSVILILLGQGPKSWTNQPIGPLPCHAVPRRRHTSSYRRTILAASISRVTSLFSTKYTNGYISLQGYFVSSILLPRLLPWTSIARVPYFHCVCPSLESCSYPLGDFLWATDTLSHSCSFLRGPVCRTTPGLSRLWLLQSRLQQKLIGKYF